MIEPDEERIPLYQLVASDIADSIVAGRYPEGALAPSTKVCAGAFGVNPATAARGLHLLVARGILRPQRGVGMRVADGAAALIVAERRESFARRRVEPLVAEAEALGMTTASVLALVAGYARTSGAPSDRTAPG